MANRKEDNLRKTQISGPLVGLVLAIAFAALSFVVAGLVLSYSAKINQDVATNIGPTTGNISTLIAGNVTSGLGTFGTNMPTIASVIVAVIIISLLFLGFGSLLTRTGGGAM